MSIYSNGHLHLAGEEGQAERLPERKGVFELPVRNRCTCVGVGVGLTVRWGWGYSALQCGGVHGTEELHQRGAPVLVLLVYLKSRIENVIAHPEEDLKEQSPMEAR